MIGFTYNNKHSSTMNVGFISQNRTVMPSKRASQYTIDGRHGTLDYGDELYETREISIKISMYGSENLEALRKQVRDVAHWFSKDGQLVFDDEPDKAYTAKVLGKLDLEQTVNTGFCTVLFMCQPFAQSTNYAQSITDITTSTKEIKIDSLGSQETPVIIVIKNIGTTTINNIELQRKAVT